ncbi:MAG: VOC family protein [Actinomycetia bacterium]|nr:VOC family protein [Actinomycetes bacterium]MCP4961800.1 VOC family protein [Actinomycetes bacterium]
MTIATFSLVALDCPDPHALAAFYQQIVGGEANQLTSDDEWVQLNIEGTSNIAFQRDDDYRPPGWPDGTPQQAHLDFDVTDLDEGEAAVLAIGAVKAEVQPRSDRWRVFIDPAGHPFCLVLV